MLENVRLKEKLFMNDLKKLKVGIIGYGKVGKIRHKCVNAHPQLELVSVCDTNKDISSKDGVVFYSDYKELLEKSPCDVVFVCTFNKFIPEIAIEAISRGIHVFSEKPPGRTLEDVQSIYKAAEQNKKVKVKFGFNHRYHEGVIEAKSIVDSKRFGEIMWIRGVYGKAGGPEYDKNWRNNKELSGGGILIDQGIHMIDLFRHFAGEYDEVKSFVGDSYWKVGVEDNVFALLRNSKTGKPAMIHSSATQWRHKFLLEIYMEKGYLEIDGILSSTMTYGRETLKIARCIMDKNGYPMPNPQENMTYYNDDNSWNDEIAEFVECIVNDQDIVNGGVVDAVATMKLLEEIYNNDIKK